MPRVRREGSAVGLGRAEQGGGRWIPRGSVRQWGALLWSSGEGSALQTLLGVTACGRVPRVAPLAEGTKASVPASQHMDFSVTWTVYTRACLSSPLLCDRRPPISVFKPHLLITSQFCSSEVWARPDGVEAQGFSG